MNWKVVSRMPKAVFDFPDTNGKCPGCGLQARLNPDTMEVLHPHGVTPSGDRCPYRVRKEAV